MKKTLVALAALASVGAAFAQSTVTLYGRVDVALEYLEQKVSTPLTGTTKTATNNPGFAINTAGLTGSRWGLRGSEDLGGGLKAIFQVESGFNVDTGASAQGGLLFGRQAFAGFEGKWGTFTLGRQYSPLDNSWGNADAQGYTTNSAMGYAWNAGVHTDVARINNSIYYVTPAMSGFNIQAMYAPGENKNPVTGQGNSEYGSIAVNYLNGPFGITAVYEDSKISQTPGTGIRGSQSTDDWMVGGQYDFGVAKLYGGFQKATRDSTTIINNAGGGKDEGWQIGVTVPIQTMTLQLGYAYEKTKGTLFVPTNNGRSEAFGGQLVYPLSKRSSVNANFLVGEQKPFAVVGLFQPNTKYQNYGLGYRIDW